MAALIIGEKWRGESVIGIEQRISVAYGAKHHGVIAAAAAAGNRQRKTGE